MTWNPLEATTTNQTPSSKLFSRHCPRRRPAYALNPYILPALCPFQQASCGGVVATHLVSNQEIADSSPAHSNYDTRCWVWRGCISISKTIPCIINFFALFAPCLLLYVCFVRFDTLSAADLALGLDLYGQVSVLPFSVIWLLVHYSHIARAF